MQTLKVEANIKISFSKKDCPCKGHNTEWFSQKLRGISCEVPNRIINCSPGTLDEYRLEKGPLPSSI